MKLAILQTLNLIISIRATIDLGRRNANIQFRQVIVLSQHTMIRIRTRHHANGFDLGVPAQLKRFNQHQVNFILRTRRVNLVQFTNMFGFSR